jgi:hypothetical protein
MSSESYIIEIGRMTVGIAVRHQGDFRFYASQGDYAPLENASYRRLRDVEQAAARVAAAKHDVN